MQSNVKVLARLGSNAIYSTIPKFREWFIINCAINVARINLLGFYIFKGERLQDDYIKSYKPKSCMAM
jgi:hypothetical protein